MPRPLNLGFDAPPVTRIADGPRARIDRRYLRALFDWHGGQGSGVYAVASTAHAGYLAPLCEVNRAACELRRDLAAVDARIAGFARRGRSIGQETRDGRRSLVSALGYLDRILERTKYDPDTGRAENA